jgi:hypothetical protein
MPDPPNPAPLSERPEPYVSFLLDAARNLREVRALFGPQSRRYQRLVAQYLMTADQLECRPAMEQVLASLNPPSQANRAH